MSNGVKNNGPGGEVPARAGHAIDGSETEISLGRLLPRRACLRFSRLKDLIRTQP